MMYQDRSIRRGEIYYVDGNRGQIGHEIRKNRPAVVVSTDESNEAQDEVTVVFLTTAPKREGSTHVSVHSAGRDSVALCESITSIDKQRLQNWVGSVTMSEQEAIDRGITLLLGLKNPVGGGETMVDGSARYKEQAKIYKKLYDELLERVMTQKG